MWRARIGIGNEPVEMARALVQRTKQVGQLKLRLRAGSDRTAADCDHQRGAEG